MARSEVSVVGGTGVWEEDEWKASRVQRVTECRIGRRRYSGLVLVLVRARVDLFHAVEASIGDGGW